MTNGESDCCITKKQASVLKCGSCGQALSLCVTTQELFGLSSDGKNILHPLVCLFPESKKNVSLSLFCSSCGETYFCHLDGSIGRLGSEAFGTGSEGKIIRDALLGKGIEPSCYSPGADGSW